jgi:hypothetical protein
MIKYFMKRTMLILAGSLLISLTALQAQQQRDTTGTQTDKRGSNPSTEYRQQDQGQMQWRDEDREMVEQERLPAPLLQTLNSDRYKGWENATIYRNRQTDEYMLVISDGSEPRTFYFDNTGRNLSDGSGNGNLNDQASESDSTQMDTEIQTQNQDQASNQWKNEDRIVVRTNEIPESLQVTLHGDEYKGWENSTIYRNRSTNEYMIEIRDGSSTRTYYFDKDGNAIKNSRTKDNDQ